MGRKAVSGIMLTLLLISSLILVFDVQPVATGNTIYIRADGNADVPKPPFAEFTPLTCEMVYVGENVTLDATASEDGWDTLPDLGHVCPIVEYRWEIDFDLDDTIDLVLTGEIAEFECLGPGYRDTAINLTVYAPDPTPPTHPDYRDTDSEVHIIHQILPPPPGIIIYYDGSVSPPDAPISSVDNITYTLTGDIYDDTGYIILVLRGNIVIDGAGYTVGGYYVGWCNNVTIKNTNIKGFYWYNKYERVGVQLFSSNHSITENTFVNSGLFVSNSYGTKVVGNLVNGKPLVYLEGVSDYTVEDAGQVILIKCNNIRVENLDLSNTTVGVELLETRDTKVIGNNIANNWLGIEIDSGSGSSSNNKIYHNNFVNNTYQVSPDWLYRVDVWDDGYPSGGNYWSDYTDADLYSGPYQNETGSDGIWDHPYIIDINNNQDRYPLVNPWTPNQPPTCSIELQKEGGKIDGIDVAEFFDIYVGNSTDDTSIKEVRFSSDDLQDGNPTGEWTEWYDWNSSLGDWNASTKNKRWSFATGGSKEVWAEVKDDIGQTDQEYANIFVHPGYAIIVAGKGRWWAWKEDMVICHCANNAYRTLRNLGFNDDHIYYLNSHGTQDVDGDEDDEVDAPALVTHFKNSLNEIKARTNGNPSLLVIYLVGHGDEAGFLFDPCCDCIGGEPGCECHLSATGQLKGMLNEFSSETRMLVFINSCYSGYFITSSSGSISGPNRIIVTSTHDGQKRYAFVWVRSSDRFWGGLNKGLNVKEAFTYRPTPGDNSHMWLDDNGDKTGHPPNDLQDDGELAATTKIGMPGTENLALTPWQLIWKRSPGELRVYDSQNRTTGLVNGEVKEEIPDSMYDEENAIVAIFFPTDVYRYEIAGNETATYELDTAFIEDGNATTFTATDIPIQNGSIHQFVVLNWTSLERGEYVVQVWIDQDGDGDYEIKVMSDSEFTPHDIAVTNVTPSKNVVGEGYLISINVTIMNIGIYTETFNVSVFYDDGVIILPDGKNYTTTILTSGNSTTLTIPWNTTGVAKGNYTITAKATILPGETDTTDNTLTDGWVVVTWCGDLDGDFDVDQFDFWDFCDAFIDYWSGVGKDSKCDFDNDCDIDQHDLWTFCAAFINYYKHT